MNTKWLISFTIFHEQDTAYSQLQKDQRASPILSLQDGRWSSFTRTDSVEESHNQGWLCCDTNTFRI